MIISIKKNDTIIKIDTKYKFKSQFNLKTGFYMRTGIIDEITKQDTNIDSFQASYPELIDDGVMGHCIHGKSGLCIKSGIQCYQNGLTKQEPNMSLSDFKKIINESKGKLFQVALGGRGDVDQHEQFEDILKYSRDNDIVPNFTSSGLGFNTQIVDICKKYCGAVAISWYRSDYTINAINMLINANVKTNIHYVLGNNTIDEAIDRLKNNDFPTGINAVIFLLHKPVGLGTVENILDYNDKRVKEFFETIDNVISEKNISFKIGFDSCTIPALINFNKSINRDSIDSCEGARYSMYITSDMIALPCSFDNDKMKWGYSISNDTIQHAWDSSLFDNFRNHFKTSCPACKDKNLCYGGCPITKEIVLCDKQEKLNIIYSI